ncbi:hypothetical protein [Hyphomicrobium sp. DY-1]|uniref:hypothetical protein n=1 Tax=Hyphomicrobium sp. DY-1 TaxID=3075650 RepID=UPI0039C055D4
MTTTTTQAHIVIGFYTPNYERLAVAFAKNLDQHAIPHHLYAVPASAWNNAILLKPQIIKRALQDFPGKTVVLMDIDCNLLGPIAPVVGFHGDISLYMGVRYHPKARKKSLRLRVLPSSRVILCHNTPNTNALIDTWQRLCADQDPARPEKDDEQLLMEAIGTTHGLALNILDKRYSGRDPLDAPKDAVITHYSAHDSFRTANEPRRQIKHLKRQFVGWIVGKPYKQWKYGIKPPPDDKPPPPDDM